MKKLVIFGAAGMVGSRFTQLFGDNYEITAPPIEEFDFLNFLATRELIEEKKPEAIVNFAAITDVERAESDKDNLEGITYRVNALAPKNLAEIARDLDIQLVHISTEYVFDGEKTDSPYTEEDKPNPINWYGKTKYKAEQFVGDSGCDATILRIAMPYAAHFDLKKDIARKFLEMLRSGQEINAISDSDITPVFTDDIAKALNLIIDKRALGIIQAVSTNSTTPFKFASEIAEAFGLNKSLIKEITFAEYNKNKKAKLLEHSWLDCSKFVKDFGEGILHSVEESVEIFKSLS